MNTHRPQRGRCPQAGAGIRDSAGHGAKSAAVRERAILALLSESSVTKAAAKSGVSEKTLRRWLAEDEPFRADYAAARQATFQAGIGRIHALTGEAIDTLATLMGRATPAAVRLGAARTLAELSIHQHDADTIMRKLDEIETYQRQHAELG